MNSRQKRKKCHATKKEITRLRKMVSKWDRIQRPHGQEIVRILNAFLSSASRWIIPKQPMSAASEDWS